MRGIQESSKEKEKLYKHCFPVSREDMLKMDEQKQLNYMNEKERLDSIKISHEKDMREKVN